MVLRTLRFLMVIEALHEESYAVFPKEERPGVPHLMILEGDRRLP